MPSKKQQPTASGGDAPAINFSESDTKLIISMWKNNRAKMDPDWEAVRVDLGAASLAAARQRFSDMKRKHNLDFNSGGSSGGSPAKTSTPRARKTPVSRSKTKKARAADDDDAEDEMDVDDATPTKKAKTKDEPADVKAEEEKQEGQDEDAPKAEAKKEVENDEA